MDHHFRNAGEALAGAIILGYLWLTAHWTGAMQALIVTCVAGTALVRFLAEVRSYRRGRARGER